VCVCMHVECAHTYAHVCETDIDVHDWYLTQCKHGQSALPHLPLP